MKPVIGAEIKWTHSDTGEVRYPIAEATEPLLFEVKANDISKAHGMKGYENPNCCIAACALRRQYGDGVFQRDTAYILQIHKGKIYAVRYRFGSSLRNGIHNFDSGEAFPEGSYNLLPPSDSQTLEAKRSYCSKSRKNSNKRYVRPHVKFNARGKITPMT